MNLKWDINRLIGEETKFSLEQRIYHSILLLGTAWCIAYSIIKYFAGTKTKATVTFGSGILLVCLYCLSALRQQYNGPMFFCLLVLNMGIIPLAWFFGAGTLDTTPYYLALISSIAAVMLSGLRRALMAGLLFVMTMALVAFAYMYPYLINGYGVIHRFADIPVELIIAVIANTLIFMIVLNNYTSGVIMDISERKQMEDELRRHRGHLEELVKERTAELKAANEQMRKEVAERKQAEAQLKYFATHDYLTHIPNRYSFTESLKKVVAKARRGQVSSLLLIDIDNFKLVNDTKGHTTGDHLLINVAKTVKENIRESDCLARLGGDEFGVLLEGATVDQARLTAEKLRKKIEDKEFCITRYSSFNLTLSIGVAMIDGTLNSQRLLSLADTALYAAKGKGGNRVILLDPQEETTTKSAAINQLVARIKNALKEDKFVLHFQPVARVNDGEVVYHEALLRLQGENGELIAPYVFIPVAERFGLMPQIDRWVVKTALNILREHAGLNLFVNISGISLSEELLLDDIEAMIARYNKESLRLGFEITENVAVQDIMLAQRWIERLKKLGCRFALDDFGIGFSSFAYLRMLPVDYLKIAGSFISDLDKDSSHRALVEAMNTVAHSLGKKTIAEYVENERVLKILGELQIDCAQGYYLGFPGPLPEELLRGPASQVE